MAEGRVLVTGATGLIGRHVVNALIERGAEVHAATRSLAHGTTNGEVRWHKTNLLDQRERIQLLDSAEPQTIVHCAWVTDHGAYWTSPENLDWTAVTLSLAHEGHERGTTRFVGVGTCAEYAWGGDEPLSETTSPLQPATLYGIAKDAARRVLEAFAATSGMSFAWARVFMLYGAREHQDRLVASLARALTHGEPAKMSSGKIERDFLDARDVGAAIAALAASPATGPVNIASGTPVTLRHVGETLARLAGRPELLALGAYPDRPGEPQTIRADITRLTRDVGFTPRISLERGLSDALDAWAPGA
ncbi:MAG: NAD(P)-dependent oxidoreductase [Alphaproteobacteria bacterium]|jgi:nucleoside-diphosphate-sugar epimerase|nr:NAD(P)-dependent oxidoreductase [Alphaproteobacteria bacterium]